MPAEAAATEAEVRAAVEGLFGADLVRLREEARWRARAVPTSQLKGRDWNDLLGDAITATLNRERLWRKEIPLVQHLRAVVRSMASHWKEAARPDLAVPASRLATEDADGEVYDPLEVAGNEPRPDDALDSKELEDAIREHFRDDALVIVILDALTEAGYSRSELPALLDLPANECEAALRRLRRFTAQQLPKRRRP